MADIMDEAREYLAEHEDACGNDACIGYEARGVIEGLIKECEIAWSSFDASEDAFQEMCAVSSASIQRQGMEIGTLRLEVAGLKEKLMDAELGRLVRDVMTRLSDTHPVNRYPALLCWSSESWEVQYIHESGIYDTDEDELSATPEDALRKADA